MGKLEDNVELTELINTKEEKLKIKSAILIMEGGPTGVALAGDIAVDFPDIKVTLVRKRIKEANKGLAQKQALMIAKNLRLEMKGGKECRRETYKPNSALAIVSLGRKEAVAQFPSATLGGGLPGLVKCPGEVEDEGIELKQRRTPLFQFHRVSCT
ncbi:hypothetical protein L6164_022160 [Bauhinia variegata]|uniref:Uncharacterized protein n=1 Tax=Bauhinia variegata TaxID=167791 RepID=A0ACB9ME68_BAUVA|nr:hypothetical protein L6164_022160 [Bauhinia variegata]